MATVMISSIVISYQSSVKEILEKGSREQKKMSQVFHPSIFH